MSPPPDARLQRLLGEERLASLRKRLRQRFERAARDQAPESFRIGKLTSDEHAALASLLGRRPRFSSSMLVDVHAVDAALRQAGIADSLRSALERLDGPIIDVAAARSELQARWSDVTDRCDHAGLAGFLRTPGGLGLLKRLSGGEPDAAARLRGRAEAVLRRLPANGVTRAQLAADALGDAHALDGGQPAATLVLAAWRQVIAPVQPESHDTPADAAGEGGLDEHIRDEKTRDVWARAGVLVNELARPAMFLNLPAREAGNYAQAAGEPGYASLRFLLRAPPSWAVEGRTVYVCENPNLLAIAADHLGSRCAPMVCTDGMPAAAQRSLLSQLTQAGARLRYHGDFDWPGVRIGNLVMREYQAQPWRFGADEYETAARAAPRPGHGLAGPEAIASWDEALAPAMRTHQLAIAEEAVVASLLQDLGG